MNIRSLYIHIPFCVRKCGYCDFVSVPLRSVAQWNRYERALLGELNWYAGRYGGCALESIYWGGGTPSMVEPELTSRIWSAVRSGFSILSDAEITLEVNPGTVNFAALRRWRRLGVNRLSIGVQSFHPRQLRVLGRIHSAAQARRTIAVARRAGFTNISLDLMYALPGQTLAEWLADITTAVECGVQHLSFYDLSLEPGTALYRRRSELEFPGEDAQIRMYRQGSRLLYRAGLRQYEISSFCRPGYAGRHNRRYWLNEEYIGIGAAAHSYLGGARYHRTRNIETYVRDAGQGRLRRLGAERLSLQRRLRETLALRLRLVRDHSLPEIERFCGVACDTPLMDALQRMNRECLVRIRGDHIRLRRRGLLLYNEVAAEIVGN